VKGYFLRIADSVSQLGNVIFYPRRGTSNHSISGDAYRFGRKRTEFLINLLLSPFERDHCSKAHKIEILRATSLLAEAGYYDEDIN